MFKCNNCNKEFVLKLNLNKHLVVCAKAKFISKNNVRHCEHCNVDILSGNYSSHLRSNTHKKKVIEQHHHLFNNVKILKSAFQSRIITYRIYQINNDNKLVIKDFLNTSGTVNSRTARNPYFLKNKL